jgi:hypothetical protein
MMRKTIFANGLKTIGLVLALSAIPPAGVTAEDLYLHSYFNGDYNLSFKPGDSKPVIPQPFLIRSQEDLAAFLEHLPKTLPDPEVMGGGDGAPYADALLEEEPLDWESVMLAVAVDSPNRKGPSRFESAVSDGKTVRMKITALDTGEIGARETVRGFYTAFLLPNRPGLLVVEKGTAKYNPALVIRADDKSGQYGIWDNAKNSWTAKPAWSHGVEFDPWGHAVVMDKQGPVMVDQKGKEVLRPFLYDNGPDYFVEGLARYVDGKKLMGFFDRTGRIAIKAQYEFAWPFEKGKATVGRAISYDTTSDEHTIVNAGEMAEIDMQGKIVKQWSAE